METILLRYENFVEPKDVTSKIYCKESGEVQAYLVENVYLRVDQYSIGTFGCIFKESGLILDSCINARKEIRKAIRPIETKLKSDFVIEEDICVLTRLWSDNYFHFWNEIMDKLLIAEELGFTGKYLIFKEPFAEEILSLAGIQEERIIWIEKASAIGKVLKCNRIFEIEGFIGNSEKSISRISNLADKITSQFSTKEKKEWPKRIYVKRIGRRKLLNDDAFFEKYGFSIMVPEEHTVLEQIKYFYYADTIICPHGAALSNGCFMRKGSTFIETFSNNFINLTAFHMLNYRGVHYRMLVEAKVGATVKNEDTQKDYYINKKLLECTFRDCLSGN